MRRAGLSQYIGEFAKIWDEKICASCELSREGLVSYAGTMACINMAGPRLCNQCDIVYVGANDPILE